MRKARGATPRVLLGILLLCNLAAADVPWASALEVGKPAPDFALPSTTGENISLRQFRGRKLVLIEFYGAAFVPT